MWGAHAPRFFILELNVAVGTLTLDQRKSSTTLIFC